MRFATAAGQLLARRWLRRLLVTTATTGGTAVVVLAVAASGGIVVRDERGCPRSIGGVTAVSWVDVLGINGETYERIETLAPHVAAVPPSAVGERIGTVRCSIADDVQRAGYQLRDGEATFLEPGTPVHALAGTPPAFRVVALDDGEPAVYENRPAAPGSAAQLLPFPAERVRAVTFLSEKDGRTVLGRLTEAEEVQAFVGALQAAPVGAVPDLGEEPRVFVALELADQPPVTVVAYPGHGVTTDGLRLPGSVLDQLPDPARDG